jgi:L-alanine-DL-glutamate epimerase-like enolase superfamily enzyme
MSIRRIDIIPLTAPYLRADTPPDHPSNGTRNCVFLRIESNDGLVGWGEAYCGCYATEVTVAALRRLERSLRSVASSAIDDPAEAMRVVRFQNRYWAMRGIGACATSAIESALLDLYAQRKGLPLWRVLVQQSVHGAAASDGHKALAYASAGDFSFSPEGIFRQARRLREHGFRAYKLRCGGSRSDTAGDCLPRDVERVAAAREAMGSDAMIFVDVGVPQRPQTWPREKAEAYLRAIAPYGVGFLEEPALTYDVEGYAALQRLRLVPIAGGESFTDPEEFEPFFRAGAYGVVQPDTSVAGGPASCMRVCRRAAEVGVPVCLHAWSGGVGIAQNLHVAWASPNVLAIEWPISLHPPQTQPLAPIVRFEDGCLLPSDRPGLGVDVSQELLKSHAYQQGHERDF